MKKILTVLLFFVSCSKDYLHPKMIAVLLAASLTVNAQHIVYFSKLNIPHDSVTNAGPRLKKIVDSLRQVWPGDTMTVIIPRALYLTDTPIVLNRSHTAYIGAGMAYTTFKAMNLHNWDSLYGVANSSVEYRTGIFCLNGSHMTLKGITWHCNNGKGGVKEWQRDRYGLIGGVQLGHKRNNDSIPIATSRASYITFDHCQVVDYYSDAFGNSYTTADHIRYLSCKAVSTASYNQWTGSNFTKAGQGFALTGADNSIIKSCTVIGALDDGGAIHKGSYDTVVNFYMTSTGGRLLVAGTDHAYIKDITLVNYKPGNYLMQLSVADDGTENNNIFISGVKFSIAGVGSVGYFIRLLAPGNNVRITNCTFNDSKLDLHAYAIRIETETEGMTTYFGDSLRITNNTYNTRYLKWIKPGSPSFTLIDTTGNTKP